MIRLIPTFLLGLAASIILWSCCPDDPFIPTKPDIPLDSSKQAYLRVVIADPAISPVNVMVDGESTFSAPLGFFDYPETVYEAQFWPVDTAARELSFVLPGGTTVATLPVTFKKGSYHTAYLYPDGAEDKVILTTDDPKASPPIEQVRYRIVNLAIGTPAVDIIFTDKGSGQQYTVSDLGYGDTTGFLSQTAALQKELVVKEHGSGRQIISIPSVLLPGGSVVTLVMTGRLHPRGDEKFIYFNTFTDSRLDAETGLYGGLPLAVELTALRFVNLVGGSDSTLDLTLEDKRFGCDFPDCFRRNFPGQEAAIINVASLGGLPALAERNYFFLSTLLYNELPYRVEVHRLDISNTSEKQTVLVGKKPFPIEASRRYTVVAFGPFSGGADAVTIFDRTPAPPSGQVNVRFFHGAYQALQGEKLRIRINGNTSQAMSYGEAPDPFTRSFLIPASGSATVEVLDESNAVVHTQAGVELKGDKTYTIFLSQGPTGNGLLLKAIADDVVPE